MRASTDLTGSVKLTNEHILVRYVPRHESPPVLGDANSATFCGALHSCHRADHQDDPDQRRKRVGLWTDRVLDLDYAINSKSHPARVATMEGKQVSNHLLFE